MADFANVTVHSSQFPGQVRQSLLESLRTREVNHKFHYDSVKQTAKWLALHQAYSPSRTDADCAAIYDQSFERVSRVLAGTQVHLLGLGCGGGQKDKRLLVALKNQQKAPFYTPSDVSTAMVLVAREAALEVIQSTNCHPIVCDLSLATDFPAFFNAHSPGKLPRIVTFFGMLPNFEPHEVLPRLADLIKPGDWLLVSANLAPGPDYSQGLRQVLPLYENELTTEWLLTFLLDLGVERSDGNVQWAIEEGQAGLKRIVAHFLFKNARVIELEGERFEFKLNDKIRLFYSYRHTPAKAAELLRQQKLIIQEQWVTNSQQEGVFMCCRSDS